jgi:hypothetical protein
LKKVWDGDFGTDVISDLTSEEIKDTTIYKAHYTQSPFTYNVTLNPNGWEVNPTFINVTYGQTYGYGQTEEKLPTPTRNGYDFGGWFTKADDTW